MENRVINPGQISVIIPVYNVESYLSRCIDSIINQTYQNFEIILIDDGSKDSSGKICDEYANKDQRIKAYHIPNGGVGNARNTALTKITGEWYGYIDSDDWIEPDYLEVLYNNAVKNNCDVTGCSYSSDSEYTLGRDKTKDRLLVLKSSEECIHNFICPGLSLNGMAAFKLYKTELFADIQFDTTLKVNEDCMYAYSILKECDRACVTSAKLYHWFMRPDSACHSKPKELNFSAADVFLFLLKETEPLNDQQIAQSLKKNYVMSVLNVLMYVPYDKNNQIVKEVKSRITSWKDEVWERLDRNHRIKYYLVTKCSYMLKVYRLLKK